MEHKIVHSLIKFLRGQKKFPKKLIKSYLKDIKLSKKDKKRVKIKLSRYNSGKFKKKSFTYLVLHAIEELNEYIEDKNTEEKSDVYSQLSLLIK